MHQLSVDDLTRLRAYDEPPCISLYQPTHRHHPDSDQDPIRYRNLRGQLENKLSAAYGRRDVRALLENYRSLEQDTEFWNHRTEGLAILSSPLTFEVYELQRPVRERVVVAPNFYTKPLLRILQSADRYQVLCLRRDDVTLYEGNRDALDPVDLSDTMPELEAVLPGEEGATDGVQVRVAPGGVAVHYGSSSKADIADSQRQRFFRAVDRAILELHSRPSGLPLILAALPEYHGHFRAVSHNPFLLAQSIQGNPDALSIDQLRALAWEQIEPLYLQRLAKLLGEYQAAKARQLASDKVAEVTAAALAGRVRTLLVEADREMPGSIDEVNARIEPGDSADPETGDVLNDLVETVARMKGEAIVVPVARMPTSSGIAAIFRF
jgi:Bacterial archaeo-eukaryotic release factor family 3